MLRILHATERPVYPFWFAGGAERASHAILSGLVETGDVGVALGSMLIAWHKGSSSYDAWSELPRNAQLEALGVRRVELGEGNVDVDVGYRARAVDRAFEAELERLIHDLRPTHVWTHLEGAIGIVRIARRHRVPTVWYVHDVEAHMQPPEQIAEAAALGAHFAACSPFVAAKARELYGIEATVVYPLVDVERYVTPRPAPDRITMINPFPEKGIRTFLPLAASMPEQKFLLVEGWRLGNRLAPLRRSLAKLPNVEFLRSQPDMRAVYARTRVLVVPSVWEEAFCRVVLEAHASGIPVVASPRGGLRDYAEGVVFVDDYQNPAAWKATLDALLADEPRLQELSRAAWRNARAARYSRAGIRDGFRDLLVSIGPGSDEPAPAHAVTAEGPDGLGEIGRPLAVYDHELVAFLEARTPPAERLRALPVDAVPLSKEERAFVAPSTGLVCRWPARNVDALARCRRFASLQRHAHTIGLGEPRFEGDAAAIGLALEDARRAGAVVSLEELASARDQVAPPTTLRTVAIATAGPAGEPLGAVVDAYARALAARGSDRAAIVIAAEASVVAASLDRAALGSTGAHVHALGEAERRAAAALLAREAGVALDLVTAALGVGSEPSRAGGALNALLLDAAGEATLLTTTARHVAPRAVSSWLTIGGSDDPTELSFDEADDEAATIARAISAHEELLGASAASLMRAALARQRLDVDGSGDAFVRDVARGRAHVALTAAGVFGAAVRGDALLTRAEGRPRHRDAVVSARAGTLRARAVARGATLTAAWPRLGTDECGVDLRRLVPPAPVHGARSLDTFGAIALRALDAVYVGHVPVATARPDADAQASAADAGDDLLAPATHALVAACASTWSPGVATPAETRLELLGHHLRGLAAVERVDLERAVSSVLLARAAQEIAALDVVLAGGGAAPWLAAVRARRDRLDAAVTDGPAWWCREPATIETLRSALASYGNLLVAWPSLVAAARGLRANGRRLARAIEP